MRYSDLVVRTTNLKRGKHVLYEFGKDKVIISDAGVRHPYMAERDEFRLLMIVEGRELTPRHGDFFTDYLLKVETRPDLRLTLSECCEHLCNGADPLELISTRKLPEQFSSEEEEKNWGMQMSMYRTGGLPTAAFLCGLQGLIRVYDLNDPQMKSPEAFRHVFVSLEKGQPLLEAVKTLAPLVLAGKRYFNGLYRSEK